MKAYKFLKMSTAISFLVITYALLSIARNQTKGYELSIYSATPLIFWIAIFFGLINGIVLLVLCTYKRNIKLFVIALFEIILCNSLLISLYSLRGYVLSMGRGDNATYVGFATDISLYGYISNSNFYPHASILISQISQLANISVLETSKYITTIFFCIYTLAIYCWAKSLFPNKKYIISSIIASIPIFFAWFSASIYYMLLSTLILPLFFYCIQRNSNVRYRILVIILCLIFPFFHPITTTMVMIYLLTLYFVEKSMVYEDKPTNTSLYLILILFVSTALWFLSQYLLALSIKHIILQLLGVFEEATTSSQSQYYVNKLGYWTAIKSVLLMTFDEISYSILSVIAIYGIIKESKKSFLGILFCFITGNLFLIVLFFFSNSHTPDRLINLNLNMIFTPILVGYVIFKSYNKKSLMVVLSFVIILSLITSMISLYQSPITSRPNDQFTVHDISGIHWFINTKNEEILTANIMSPLFRYSDLLYGQDYRSKIKNIRSSLPLENHFNISPNYVMLVDQNMYLLITEYDIQAYTKPWKNINRFDEEDFEKIDLCINVNKIYDNKELCIRYVNKAYAN